MILIKEKEKQELKKLLERYIHLLHERHGFAWAADLPDVAFKFVDLEKMVRLYG